MKVFEYYQYIIFNNENQIYWTSEELFETQEEALQEGKVIAEEKGYEKVVISPIRLNGPIRFDVRKEGYKISATSTEDRKGRLISPALTEEEPKEKAYVSESVGRVISFIVMIAMVAIFGVFIYQLWDTISQVIIAVLVIVGIFAIAIKSKAM